MKHNLLIAHNSLTENSDYQWLNRNDEFNLFIFTSGKEALDFIESGQDIALAVIYADLSDLNGYETTLRIRQSGNDLPVILLVHHNSLQSIRLATMVGCSHLLQLPVPDDELEIIIRQHLSVRQTAKIQSHT